MAGRTTSGQTTSGRINSGRATSGRTTSERTTSARTTSGRITSGQATSGRTTFLPLPQAWGEHRKVHTSYGNVVFRRQCANVLKETFIQSRLPSQIFRSHVGPSPFCSTVRSACASFTGLFATTMVLFPAKKGENRVFKSWTPAEYAKEEKASAKHKRPWQERGPSIPSSCGGEWRGQRYRPRQGQEGSEQKKPRWGNKGGKKHQKKKRNRQKTLDSLLQDMSLLDADEETEPSASASLSATSSSACSKASSAPGSASPSAASSSAFSEEPLKPKGHYLYHARANDVLIDCFAAERKHQTCPSIYRWTVDP